MHDIRRPHLLPIHDALLQRVREDKAGAFALLLLMFDLRFYKPIFELRSRDPIDLADILAIARQAWDTNAYIIRLEALELLQSNARVIRERGPEAEAAVVNLLETFDVSKNILLSTQWLETRSCFAGFETGIDVDSALDEFRGIIATAAAGDDPLYQLEREADPNITFSQFIASRASGALGNIFEDIFQGAYYEAYDLLRAEEKKTLLTLALQETRIGLFTDWYLTQLCTVGCEGAEDVLRRYGARIDPNAFCPQECVTCFILAHEAWAKIANNPIPYQDVSSEDHRVWAIVGEFIFWLGDQDNTESAGRISFLCDELLRFPRALPGVLREIDRSASVFKALLTRYGDGIRKTLHESLRYEGQVTSVFRHLQSCQNELFLWTISMLADIGDRESIILLKPWTESATYGKDVICAIEQIEQRESGPRRHSAAL